MALFIYKDLIEEVCKFYVFFFKYGIKIALMQKTKTSL